MAELMLPVLLVLLVWWFATGAILYLGSLPRATYPWTFLAATLIAIAALAGLRVSAASTSVAAACYGFVGAILIWGWVEVGFLLGGITGPRRAPCPPGARGAARFKLAVEALLYHELALIIAAVVIALLSLGQPNKIGLWTFLLLWAMRQSAKLNLFLGVSNLFAHLMPAHLAYLASYQRSGRVSLLFGPSILVITVTLAWLAVLAHAGETDFETTHAVLLATLVALGMLEHWFMVLPLPSDRLWTWALPEKD